MGNFFVSPVNRTTPEKKQNFFKQQWDVRMTRKKSKLTQSALVNKNNHIHVIFIGAKIIVQISEASRPKQKSPSLQVSENYIKEQIVYIFVQVVARFSSMEIGSCRKLLFILRLSLSPEVPQFAGFKLQNRRFWDLLIKFCVLLRFLVHSFYISFLVSFLSCLLQLNVAFCAAGTRLKIFYPMACLINNSRSFV